MTDGAKSGGGVMLDRLTESVAAKFALRILMPLLLDRPDRMQHRRMVAPAERPADLDQRQVERLDELGQVAIGDDR